LNLNKFKDSHCYAQDVAKTASSFYWLSQYALCTGGSLPFPLPPPSEYFLERFSVLFYFCTNIHEDMPKAGYYAAIARRMAENCGEQDSWAYFYSTMRDGQLSGGTFSCSICQTQTKKHNLKRGLILQMSTIGNSAYERRNRFPTQPPVPYAIVEL
jgi:hypothetical protein